ncbi:MAG: hypothetical protein GTO45_40305 [Candidatus Aminicenantes bacterium]|nr:hypothetical protein [Candidatus Aminicenantes bacterium]NIM84857.1 hypothetical protein [Candidatus Aminicenantes bacterium]NIN24365.1 hypothetical protein [Candidatus Aminicenantes bacterium]NIN48129.1 hypothetical protein [Candidatus Aminicenantes bacterium]NIN91027.1 hypothetical protein [Candidatus Aminicenantes bacterium]
MIIKRFHFIFILIILLGFIWCNSSQQEMKPTSLKHEKKNKLKDSENISGINKNDKKYLTIKYVDGEIINLYDWTFVYEFDYAFAEDQKKESKILALKTQKYDRGMKIHENHIFNPKDVISIKFKWKKDNTYNHYAILTVVLKNGQEISFNGIESWSGNEVSGGGNGLNPVDSFICSCNPYNKSIYLKGKRKYTDKLVDCSYYFTDIGNIFEEKDFPKNAIQEILY